MSTTFADALVIHGHGLTPENNLDIHTTQRMDTGLNAWRNGVAQNFVVSGNYSFMLKSPPAMAEAAVMKQYALQHEVSEADINVEDASLDTVGNALFTKTTLAIPNAWEQLIVVTSESHCSRMLNVYRHVFGNEFEIKVIPAPEQIGLREKIWEPLGSAMVREVLRGTQAGDHDAIKERLFDLVPGYGDSTVPRLAARSLFGLLRKA